MRQLWLVLIGLSLFPLVQGADARYYWIGFTDKGPAWHTNQAQENYLSVRSLDRRQRMGIGIDLLDVQVFPAYIDSLARHSMILEGTSRWFNAVLIKSADSAVSDWGDRYPFIAHVDDLGFVSSAKCVYDDKDPPFPDFKDMLAHQDNTAFLNGSFLHEQGYQGQGVAIAVMDAGFLGVDSLSFLYTTVHGVRDYVDGDSHVFHASSHGTKVLSLMAARHDELMGTAPRASYFLYRTEDAERESKVEELFWVMAAEHADSLGVDLINTSLGYAQFDDLTQNYTYSDMDGATTYIGRASSIAASRGMMLVSSAGNMGNKVWKYITTPADAEGVLSVGAVDYQGKIAGFSSFGPTADGRVKPELLAPGQYVKVIDEYGQPVYGSGTSYAAPILAGMVAALMQKYPKATPAVIQQALVYSASRYAMPEPQYGYGIPDFLSADRFLHTHFEPESPRTSPLFVFPNPSRRYLHIKLAHVAEVDAFTIRLIDSQGRVVASYQRLASSGGSTQLFRIPVDKMLPGTYLCHVEAEGFSYAVSFIVKPV